MQKVRIRVRHPRREMGDGGNDSKAWRKEKRASDGVRRKEILEGCKNKEALNKVPGARERSKVIC